MEASRRPGRHARLSRRALLGGGGLALAALAGGTLTHLLTSSSPATRTGTSVPTPAPTEASTEASEASNDGAQRSGNPTPRSAPGAVPSAPPAPATPQSGSLTPQQRLGQLFVVGLSSGAGATALAEVNDAITGYHAGSLVLYGAGWRSAGAVQEAVQPLQALAAGANGGVGLFVAGNQEGGDAGAFQAFYGPGFSSIPSALAQAQGDPAVLAQQAQGWGQELAQAGVNLNLAPVLDTVPRSMVASNDPIGRWQREYGTDPQTVATYGLAFLQGMRAGGVAVCAKHFPGLGRVSGNTDYTAQGIVDNQFSGADDPFLLPYKAAIAAKVDFVMVSLAVYPQVDSQPAVFSAPIVTGLLRQTLAYPGVIITDDIGAAAAVADRTPGERALGFLRAGGDMLLTVDATAIAPMTAAIRQAMATDPTFAAAVNASIDRILQLKARYGLLPASAVS